MTNNKTIDCDFYGRGRVTSRVEEMAFRQSSDKGDVNCRVTLLVGTCDKCHSKSLGPESEEIFKAAFRCEYDKLP